MWCNRCGEKFCTCKPKMQKTTNDWVVDPNDLEILREEDFQIKRDRNGGMGFYARMMMPHFKTKKEAEADKIKQLNLRIQRCTNELADYTKQLKEMKK